MPARVRFLSNRRNTRLPRFFLSPHKLLEAPPPQKKWEPAWSKKRTNEPPDLDLLPNGATTTTTTTNQSAAETGEEARALYCPFLVRFSPHGIVPKLGQSQSMAPYREATRQVVVGLFGFNMDLLVACGTAELGVVHTLHSRSITSLTRTSPTTNLSGPEKKNKGTERERETERRV